MNTYSIGEYDERVDALEIAKEAFAMDWRKKISKDGLNNIHEDTAKTIFLEYFLKLLPFPEDDLTRLEELESFINKVGSTHAQLIAVLEGERR